MGAAVMSTWDQVFARRTRRQFLALDDGSVMTTWPMRGTLHVLPAVARIQRLKGT